MFKKYTLESAMPGDPPLEFEWDIETGEIKGAGARLVQREVGRAVAQGSRALYHHSMRRLVPPCTIIFSHQTSPRAPARFRCADAAC